MPSFPDALWLLIAAAFCLVHAFLYADLTTAFAGLCLAFAAFTQAWEATRRQSVSDDDEYVPPRDRLGL